MPTAKLRQLADELNRDGTANPPIRGAFKLEEARHYLGGLSIPTMHRLIQRGLLKPNRSLRHLIFSRTELDRFLASGQ